MATTLARDRVQYTLPLPGKVKGKAFYGNAIDEALQGMERQGYVALFMPQIIDARIEASGDSKIWKNNYFTASLSATGRTKQGNAVVVYAHSPHYFLISDNAQTARRESLEKDYSTLPQEEFQRLVDSDGAVDQHGNRVVWVIDYKKLKGKSYFGDGLSVDQALEHPSTIPILGGEKRAVKYLRRHKEILGDKVDILYTDDLHEVPVGRLLAVRWDFFDVEFKGLPDLIWGGFYFVGARPEDVQKLVLTCTTEDVERATKALEKLKGTVKKEQLAPLELLLRKI